MSRADTQEDLNAVIRQHSELLAAQLHAQRESLFPPDASKTMRKFTSGEAAALLGVNDSYLRKLHLDGKGPSPEVTSGNRRHYSAEDIHNLRILLEKTARKPGDYLPGRRAGDHLQIIGVMNFKGGSGKTTSSAHLAQRLALKGYRVLAIDLDPQASLTALHGVQPEFDLLDGGTLYDAIRYEDPVPIAEVIRKTYIPNLDLIPGNLELMEFEHETPRALSRGNAGLFFFRVKEALAQVDDRNARRAARPGAGQSRRLSRARAGRGRGRRAHPPRPAWRATSRAKPRRDRQYWRRRRSRLCAQLVSTTSGLTHIKKCLKVGSCGV